MSKKTEKNFKNYCTSHSLRLTPPRLSAFKIVHSAKKPITAYEVLERMGKDIKNPKPPTAYRALDFLTRHGFVHRIESLNAYVSCDSDHKHKGSQFMICDNCGKVEEVHQCKLPAPLKERISEEDFCMRYWNVEVHGKCKKCRGDDPNPCEEVDCD